jgi:uncharacterized damage-inducible protein DinB
MTPGGRGGWEELKGQAVALAPIQAYAAAVQAETDAYLASLTDEELRREMPWPFGGTRTVADFLALLVVHTVFHAGEVSALKGVQGVRGIAF